MRLALALSVCLFCHSCNDTQTSPAIGQKENSVGVWTKQGVVIVPNTADLNGGTSFSGTSNPFVIYESGPQIVSANPDGKVFKMWFGGANNTYYAESNDGLSWTRRSTALITGFGFPRIFKNNGTYYLYVEVSPANPTSVSLYTSPDGITFTSQGIVLNVGTAGAWDSASLFFFHPAFIDGNGVWHATYTGSSNTAGPFTTGLATSTDGINWTKYPSNPVFASGVIGANIHVVNGTYYAWSQLTTFGQGGAQPNLDPSDIARTQSADFLAWSVPFITLPRTLPSEGVGSNNGEIAPPSLVDVAGKTYIYYTGSPTGPSGTGYQIHAATAPIHLLSLVQGNEGMAIAFVQSPTPPAFATATNYASTFGVNNTAGNLLFVAALIADTGAATLSISDSQGNTYDTSLAPVNNGAQTYRAWFVSNCKAGANTVTVTCSASKLGSLILAEYSGINTLDQSGLAVSATGTAAASPSKTTTVANELLVGAFSAQNGGMSGQTLGTGTNVRQTVALAFSLVDRIVALTGTYQGTATVGSGNWTAGITTFFQSIGSGGSGAYHVNRFRKFII